MANETAAKPMAVVAKPIATSANATISKKNETQKLAQTGQNRAMQTNISKNATKVVPKVSKTKIQQKGSSELSSDSNSAPVSNTFTQEVTWGENTDLVIETAAPEVQKEQSLATAHEKEQINAHEKEQSSQKGGSASTVQTQVLNIANVESKGKSINQNKAIVQSTQSLVQQDLKLVDQEKKSEPAKQETKQVAKPQVVKQEAPKPKPQEQKHEEPKKIVEKAKQAHKDEAESWFAASLDKFRNLKKRMFSALSFLPQTGETDEPPEDFENIMLTNQQKLGLFDTIVNEEEPGRN